MGEKRKEFTISTAFVFPLFIVIPILNEKKGKGKETKYGFLIKFIMIKAHLGLSFSE
jgi:hypothetical protein